jgi:NADH-quinone oxidoreductase subunit N
MNASQLAALSPLIILGFAPVVLLAVLIFVRSHAVTAVLAIIALAGTGVALVRVYACGPCRITPLIVFDSFAAAYIGLILGAAVVVILISYAYMQRFRGNREEYYILLLLATFGASVLASSAHFASFFLGYEILSVSLYSLIAYPHAIQRNIEAAMKYLILAAASSAFLLLGMAVCYAGARSLDFGRIGELLRHLPPGLPGVVMLTGAALLVVGLSFKLALVPFHWWTPDVYQGAPAPVTGFVATVSKGGIVALLVRLFAPVGLHPGGPLYLMFLVIAAASMIVGNLMALFQDNVKRILAYSSIAHLGYLMVAVLAGGRLAYTAVAFYLMAYFVTILGAFGVVTLLSEPGNEAEHISDYQGLFWSRPWLGAVFTAMLLSLAGIPLTAGFFGKIFVLTAGVGATRWTLALILVIGSTIGLFYYLRIIAALFAKTPSAAAPRPAPSLSVLGGGAVVLLTLVLFWLGIYPTRMAEIFWAAFG